MGLTVLAKTTVSYIDLYQSLIQIMVTLKFTRTKFSSQESIVSDKMGFTRYPTLVLNRETDNVDSVTLTNLTSGELFYACLIRLAHS